MTLPLLEYTSELFENRSEYTVIACQHLLEPNAEMLLELTKNGFKPENIHVIPKAYSFNTEISDLLTSKGLNVHKIKFDSHKKYDYQHYNNIEAILSKINKKPNTLLIDDGGLLIDYILEHPQSTQIRAIEQTSSGYNRLNNREIPFPIINIARSKTKLLLESPYIAELVVSRLKKYTQENKTYNTLIMGNGAIGRSIKKQLNANHKVTMYDTKHSHVKYLEDVIEDKDIIIGCTGSVSIPAEFHKFLGKVLLINASSSDREFDAVFIRRTFKKNNDPHANYKYRDIQLINSGFPITFLGNKHEVEPTKIQITQSLLLAAALSITQNEYKNGFQQLDKELEEKIRNQYIQIKTYL